MATQCTVVTLPAIAETATALARAVCMPKDMVRLTAMDSNELRGTVISHTVRVSFLFFLLLSFFQ